jgi:magnesium-transporting ATPase (P-type)
MLGGLSECLILPYFLTHSFMILLGIYRLQKNKITCFDKSRLINSGKINTIIFNKTGTLCGKTLEIDGYYIPNYGGMESTFEAFLAQQMSADIASLYNNQIYIDFEYPNKLKIMRAGNVDVNLASFVVDLLVEHSNLQTISPTKMETFESLAQADVARFLYMNLRYYDNLDTIYINIDLKLSELEQEGNKRDQIIDDMKNAYTLAASDTTPLIWSVPG